MGQIAADIDLGSATEVAFKVRKGQDEESVIAIDEKQSQLFGGPYTIGTYRAW
jgi:hypothetical protein